MNRMLRTMAPWPCILHLLMFFPLFWGQSIAFIQHKSPYLDRKLTVSRSKNWKHHEDFDNTAPNWQQFDNPILSKMHIPSDQSEDDYLTSRRTVGKSLLQLSAILAAARPSSCSSSWAAPVPADLATVGTTLQETSSRVREVLDPNTYPALVYEPPNLSKGGSSIVKPPPLLLVLHGAATNQEPSVRKALGDSKGEHAGLPMQLLASNTAPAVLADNFCVAAPYSLGKRSFYEDSRGKLLSFVQFLADRQIVQFDPTRIFLFGFSDGATVAVELATSRKFKGVVVASYGFTGQSLPSMALQRLQGVGFWVFHSADDVIFDVSNSDRLVTSLQQTNGPASETLIRYTRYDKDPLPVRLGIPVDRSMRGHTMGIMAAQTPDLYQWLLSL